MSSFQALTGLRGIYSIFIVCWHFFTNFAPADELLAIRQSVLLCSGHLVLRGKRVPSRNTLSGKLGEWGRRDSRDWHRCTGSVSYSAFRPSSRTTALRRTFGRSRWRPCLPRSLSNPWPWSGTTGADHSGRYQLSPSVTSSVRSPSGTLAPTYNVPPLYVPFFSFWSRWSHSHWDLLLDPSTVLVEIHTVILFSSFSGTVILGTLKGSQYWWTYMLWEELAMVPRILHVDLPPL